MGAVSCADAQVYPQHELAAEILSARPGHEGQLTNQACTLYKADQCMTWSVKEYSLSDPTFRETANKLSFICKIAGKRYKICADQPGFCRITYSGSIFQQIFGGMDKSVEFIPSMPYQFLLDSGVKCFSQAHYSWGEVQ